MYLTGSFGSMGGNSCNKVAAISDSSLPLRVNSLLRRAHDLAAFFASCSGVGRRLAYMYMGIVI